MTQTYARAVRRQMGLLREDTRDEPQPSEFNDVLEKSAQPDGYLHAYEALSDFDSELPPKEDSAGHSPWRECFMVSGSVGTPIGSSPPTTGGARAHPTAEQVAARRHARRSLEHEEVELDAAQESSRATLDVKSRLKRRGSRCSIVRANAFPRPHYLCGSSPSRRRPSNSRSTRG